MPYEEIISRLSLAVSMVFALILLRLFLDAGIDDLRDRLFEIRDRLFLYAYAHDLLDSPAHRELRMLLNGSIRYAHRLSLTRLLLFSWGLRVARVKRVPNVHLKRWQRAVSTLPEAHRKFIEDIHEEVLTRCVTHTVRWFPPFVPFYLLLRAGFWAVRAAGIFDLGWKTALEARARALIPVDAMEDEAIRAAA